MKRLKYSQTVINPKTKPKNLSPQHGLKRTSGLALGIIVEKEFHRMENYSNEDYKSECLPVLLC